MGHARPWADYRIAPDLVHDQAEAQEGQLIAEVCTTTAAVLNGQPLFRWKSMGSFGLNALGMFGPGRADIGKDIHDLGV